MVLKFFTVLFCLSSLLFAKVNVIVSIVPQKAFVEAIGGEFVDVQVMVLPGNSPHNYEPKPTQMVALSKAQLYMSIGVEFENVWLEKFAYQNKKMRIVDSSNGIKKLALKEDGHHGANAKSEHQHSGLDPHVWVSPENVKVIAKNIFEALSAQDSEHKAYYNANYVKFLTTIDRLDNRIKEHLKGVKKESKFMVFHPSWGYFAHQYDLEQVAIEVEGKEPKSKELAHILEEAKEENVRAIFVQPEFSDKSAKQIAQTLGIQVIKVSPLAKEWEETLLQLASAIAQYR